MSRPGLIIGLGGTGQWVLTWLKRDLLLSNGGRLPSNVRLLSIDTATQLEAGVRLVAGRQEEAVKVGEVSLEAGEFVYVGGDSRPLAQRVKEGGFENIRRWYHAQRWLDILPPAVFTLDDGAGRIRQFGRIAVFKDIMGQEPNSRIWRSLRNAIEGVNRQVTVDRKLEIIVVGSFAGGTGSGMFLDIALLLRMLANQLGVHHVLRGFFALPSVFSVAPDKEMKARTFAAWRELNRFMVVNSDFPMPLIEYVENNPNFRINPTQRIFDACYLVDSKRKGAAIASDAKYGVHPMVAEVVSAILDEHAGTDYTQYIFTNLAPEYARTPDTPLYSALGSYTVQVPAHYKQEVGTLAFTNQLLRTVLAPRDKGFVTQGAERHLELAAPDQNQEAGIGFPGRSHSRTLLSTETISYGGETAKPTPFTGRIADVVQQAVDKNRRASIVDQMARAGGAQARQGVAAAGWMGYFTNLGDDPQIEQLRKNLNAEASYNLLTQFQRRQGEKPEEAQARFAQIPTEVRKRYGGLIADGREVHGTFGDRLREAQEFHLTLFRRLVRLRLLDILMGRSEQDPVRAKSGKLGYAWDYFDGLVDEFEQFLNVMEEIKRRREEVKPEIKLQGLSENARKFMEQKADAKLFWIFEAPSVKRSEDSFLQAQQRVVDLRKEDLLHLYVVEAARVMMATCIEVRNTLQRWIWHLTTGDDPSQIPGLIRNVEQTLKSVQTDHAFDTRTPAVQRLVAEQLAVTDPDEIAAALSQWEWVADFSPANQLTLQVRIKPEATGQAAHLITDPSTQPTAELRRQLGIQNQHGLTSLARRRFEGTAGRTTVAEEIKKLFPNPSQFAGEISPGAEPLFDSALGTPPRRKSNLIRVMAPPNDPYFYGPEGLEGFLRREQGLDVNQADDTYNIRVVASENAYKLTLVRTDDLYPYDAFAAWEQCAAAYAEHLGEEGQPQDPVLMHNFSAEAQAVSYERAFMREGADYRPLHPRMVMLLENPQALRQFLYLGMFGLIRDQKSPLYRWELTWERQGKPQTFWLTRGWDADRDKGVRPTPDIMNAIHGYVIRQRTWQEGRTDKIDYAIAERLIKNEQQRLGPQEEAQLIRDMLEHGLIARLHEQAQDPDLPERILRQDLYDLARVATMMLNERLETLAEGDKTEGNLWVGSRERRPEPTPPPVSGSSPFATPTSSGTPSSRLDGLLDQQTFLQQFLYLGMLGLLQEREDRRGYRWELAWDKETGEQVYWLTQAWDARVDRQRPRPDLIDALQGYILARRSLQAGREELIDYAYAEHLIEQARQRLGTQGEAQMLDDNLGEAGFIGWLRSQAYDPDVPDRLVQPEFDELARVAERMLEERLDGLVRRRKHQTASPFKVYRPDAPDAHPASGAEQGGDEDNSSNPFLTRRD